jgi:putative transposase
MKDPRSRGGLSHYLRGRSEAEKQKYDLCKIEGRLSVPSCMDKPAAYRTWARQRACRLPSALYEGYAVHIVIVSRERTPVFSPSALASEVFALVASDRQTFAACLMPDHLHWLLQVTGDVSARISRFKSISTRMGWRHGTAGALWQRTFHDRILRDEREIQETARYITENPLRAGLVARIADYHIKCRRRDLETVHRIRYGLRDPTRDGASAAFDAYDGCSTCLQERRRREGLPRDGLRRFYAWRKPSGRS